MAAGNVSRGGSSAPYRKRRPLPALIMLIMLGLGATYIWLHVWRTDAEQAAAAGRCAPAKGTAKSSTPPQPASAGQVLATDALDRTVPAPPSDALVQVLNASSQRGEAGIVTESLRQLGFNQVGEPGNDKVYGDNGMTCRAQIRFGHQGMAAARTLSLLEPCAELVRDERQDATVDLAVGRKFDELRPGPEARAVLQQLEEWAAQQPEDRGGLQSDNGSQPQVDPGLLAAARNVPC